MTNTLESTLADEEPDEDTYTVAEGHDWIILDAEPQAQGRVGRVKWATKRWQDDGATWYLVEVAVLAQDGTVQRMREKSTVERYITDRLLRAVHQHA